MRWRSWGNLLENVKKKKIPATLWRKDVFKKPWKNAPIVVKKAEKGAEKTETT
ncbi:MULTISPECIES: hypothetical protein [Pseudomonas]|uniref:hypothetical protein n=1 Tax=Pseudomonas TaxID=286 RepID=UPI00249AF620|nr:hypothetical protein [Pseudomonas sp. PS01300]